VGPARPRAGSLVRASPSVTGPGIGSCVWTPRRLLAAARKAGSSSEQRWRSPLSPACSLCEPSRSDDAAPVLRSPRDPKGLRCPGSRGSRRRSGRCRGRPCGASRGSGRIKSTDPASPEKLIRGFDQDRGGRCQPRHPASCPSVFITSLGSLVLVEQIGPIQPNSALEIRQFTPSIRGTQQGERTILGQMFTWRHVPRPYHGSALSRIPSSAPSTGARRPDRDQAYRLAALSPPGISASC
jgi:hypothetical protein